MNMAIDIHEMHRRKRAGDGPDWRSVRVENLMGSNAKPDRLDDHLTIQLWRHRVRVHAASPPLDAVMDAASNIHSDDGPQRWEIEARLLAGVSIEDIATRLGLPADVIQTFADLFFDVQQRLEAHDWILLRAVKVGPMGNMVLDEADFWRYAAVAGGPLLLDVLVGDYLRQPESDFPHRSEMAENIRMCSRLLTTPITDKVAFWPILDWMWEQALKVKVHDEKWEWMVQYLEALDFSAGLNAAGRRCNRAARAAERAQTRPAEQAAGQKGSEHPGHHSEPAEAPDAWRGPATG